MVSGGQSRPMGPPQEWKETHTILGDLRGRQNCGLVEGQKGRNCPQSWALLNSEQSSARLGEEPRWGWTSATYSSSEDQAGRKSVVQRRGGWGEVASTPPTSTAGYYMFIETSRPRELGDRARLVSPLYNASAKFYCVSFFYHMYGKHIGELEAVILTV